MAVSLIEVSIARNKGMLATTYQHVKYDASCPHVNFVAVAGTLWQSQLLGGHESRSATALSEQLLLRHLDRQSDAFPASVPARRLAFALPPGGRVILLVGLKTTITVGPVTGLAALTAIPRPVPADEVQLGVEVDPPESSSRDRGKAKAKSKAKAKASATF